MWDDGIETRDASAVLPLYFAHVSKATVKLEGKEQLIP